MTKLRYRIGQYLPLILLLSLIPITHAPDVPYSQPPANANFDYTASIFPSDWGFTNGDSGQLINGQNSTDFTGKILTSIGIYLGLSIGTGGEPNPPVSGAHFATIGVFDNAANIRMSFGTVDIANMPRAYSGQNAVAQEFTRTGSYFMQAGDIIGVSYSDNTTSTGYQVVVFCGNVCNGTEVSNGAIVGCAPPPMPMCARDNGFALAGDFTFANSPESPKPSITASSILVVVFLLIIMLMAYAYYDTPERAKEITMVGLGAAIIGVVFIVFQAMGI